MESIATILTTHDMSCHDMKEEMKSHDISHDIKDTISKNDYFYLVETLEKWRVFYPKAQIKKYGAKNCWEAMNRVKLSNARVPGAYFTITVRNLINDKKHEASSKENKTVETNQTPLKEEKYVNIPKNDLTPVKSQRGLPNITNLREAYNYLYNLKDKDLENENVYEFVQQIKKKYNFG